MSASKVNNFFSLTHEYLTYVFFFLIPLPDKFLTLALGLWCVSWLLWRVSHHRERFSLSRNSKIGLGMLTIYTVLSYSSAFWGRTPELAAHLMEHRLGMWMLTLILLFGFPRFLKFSNIVKSFLLGNLSMVLIYLVRLLLMFVSDGTTKYQLDVVGLAAYFDGLKHPAYMSLNLILAFFLYLSIQKRFNRHNIIPLIILYVTFGLIIFVAHSRAGLMSYALCSMGAVVYYARQRLSIRQLVVLGLPLLVLFGAGMLSTHKFHLMFDESEHVSVRAPRKILWKTGVQMVAEKPLLGYGLGSSKADFVEKSKENGLYLALEKRFNAHNQYIETALESGLLSLILFIFALLFLAKAVERKRRAIIFVVLGVFGFALFFESMLLRIAGLSIFIALLVTILTLSHNKQYVSTKPDSARWMKWPILLTFTMLILMLTLRLHSHFLTFDPLQPRTYASKDYVVLPYQELPQPVPQQLQDHKVDAALYDNRSKASLWSGNAYLINELTAKNLKEGEVLIFSVYCFVSKDFDGEWVKISIDNVQGKPPLVQDFYNLKQKGTWQKLYVRLDSETGSMPAHFFFSRYNCNSLANLQGYVLFAYPQYIISEK